MAKLEVQIGADSSELKTEIAKAEILISKLRKEKAIQVKAGLDTLEITKNINEVKGQLRGLNAATKQTGESFSKLAKPVQNGGNTLMQFSRIAQDAPFGIMGIGNNITATAESFAYLSTSAGGTGNALKAVAASMMGTGGILLAVSLVTTALTIMSQNGITIGDVFDKLTGNFNEFGGALKKASEEATKSAIEESGALQGLVAVAQSETVSRQARTQAVKDLQSQYPAYFGNLSNEQIMYGNLTGTINDVTNALISKGIQEQLTKDAVNPTLDLWRANGRLNKAKVDQIKLEKDLAKETAKRIAAGFGGRTNEEVSLMNSIANTKLAITSTREDIKDLTVGVNSYKKAIAEASKASSQLLIKPPPAVKASTTPVKQVSTGSTPQVAPLQSSLNPVGLAAPAVAPLPIAASIRATTEAVTEQTLAMQLALNEFNDSAKGIIDNNISNTFANLGTIIGQGLTTGGNVLKAAGSTLLAGLGGILVDLGKMAIQVGVGLLGIKTALKTLNPAVAIAGGVALIAVGSVFSASAKGLGNSMGGGSSSGGSGGGFSTGASVSSPTSSSNSNSSGGFQNVVFEISGQSLIGVLNNTLDRNTRLGGGLRLSN